MQPDIIQVFDICFDKNGAIKMLSMRDDEFYIDKVDYKHAHDEEEVKRKKEN